MRAFGVLGGARFGQPGGQANRPMFPSCSLLPARRPVTAIPFSRARLPLVGKFLPFVVANT